ncbi:hypothetical protein GCM10020358_61450 [Amorphoplanes nipponensis]|uniref:Uncharacterized protein n=1 Tax=Actinoplanes nipponensis TaxID=135950 RepID=A0A919JVV7_9ACTN|nr:hypothetical protein [Actinoplanes nipponensis]GIE53949.1 hypothetical protein Ani05nite_74830 [Actinoplanes nipponensis]
MSEPRERTAFAVAMGVLAAVAGAVLLLAALDVWRPSLSWAGPAALVATGLALLVGGTARPVG